MAFFMRKGALNAAAASGVGKLVGKKDSNF